MAQRLLRADVSQQRGHRASGTAEPAAQLHLDDTVAMQLAHDRRREPDPTADALPRTVGQPDPDYARSTVEAPDAAQLGHRGWITHRATLKRMPRALGYRGNGF